MGGTTAQTFMMRKIGTVTALAIATSLLIAPASIASASTTSSAKAGHFVDSTAHSSSPHAQSGHTVRLAVSWKQAPGEVGKPTLTLQRRTAGHAWKTVKARIVIGKSYRISTKAPAYKVSAKKSSQTVLYRFKSIVALENSRKAAKTIHSRAIRIVYANPTRPSGETAMKGVATWNYDGVNTTLPDSGAKWYYTWGSADSNITVPQGAEYVPMIWGRANVTSRELAAAKAASGNTLLAFNEPDLAGQSNMTVEQALDEWPKLQATGLELGSPATAYGAESAGSWLDKFMTGAAQRGYRVDFIALHWYLWDGSVAGSVKGLKTFLTDVHNRYDLPIWLTEFSAVSFANGTTETASVSEQAAFLTASVAMMNKLSFVERYAWFALPPMDDLPTASLYGNSNQPTPVGKAFKKLP